MASWRLDGDSVDKIWVFCHVTEMFILCRKIRLGAVMIISLPLFPPLSPQSSTLPPLYLCFSVQSWISSWILSWTPFRIPLWTTCILHTDPIAISCWIPSRVPYWVTYSLHTAPFIPLMNPLPNPLWTPHRRLNPNHNSISCNSAHNFYILSPRSLLPTSTSATTTVPAIRSPIPSKPHRTKYAYLPPMGRKFPKRKFSRDQT